jgi:hypothetical protein
MPPPPKLLENVLLLTVSVPELLRIPPPELPERMLLVTVSEE